MFNNLSLWIHFGWLRSTSLTEHRGEIRKKEKKTNIEGRREGKKGLPPSTLIYHDM